MMALKQTLRGELKQHESLSRYTSWRVGGNARQLFRPADVADLAAFLQQLPGDEAVLWLGLGSNLLIRDGGFDGTVIVTAGVMQHIDVEGLTLKAEVGTYCSKLAKQAAKAGLKGAAFLAGIPGTLGGALAMNAGAHGGETWDFVTRVTTIDKHGQLRERPASDFEVSYRHVVIPQGEWFVAAEMQFEAGDAAHETALIRDLLKKRNASQPTNQPCAGSVFTNPPGDYAGRLIETSDLKGLKLGGASVSTKHANFIVNDGDASAADIENLIKLVQQTVKEKQGVELVPEVRIIGEAEQ
jgi:UDP-N-acetylmuramate dehydrogenase